MKYHVHYGKVGTYGEVDKSSYRNEKREPIASIEGNGPTYIVTLYNAAGKMFPRDGFTMVQAKEIVAAHLKERGYEHDKTRDTWDLKAYND